MTTEQTTWRECFDKARENWQDTSEVVAIAPDEAVLDVTFDPGWGGAEGQPLTIWTFDRVYFPVVYDGAEWLESAPRMPSNEAMSHVGGQ